MHLKIALKLLLVTLLLTGCHEQDAEQPVGQSPEQSTGQTSTQPDQVAPETTIVAAAPAVTQDQKMPNIKQSLPVANEGTRAELTQRYNDIKTMIGEARASDVQQCRKVAFGYKACGGPASYLIYSVQGLDEVLLLKKVSEYNALAEAESRRLGLMSDCAIVPEPSVSLVGGVCKAGPGGDIY